MRTSKRRNNAETRPSQKKINFPKFTICQRCEILEGTPERARLREQGFSTGQCREGPLRESGELTSFTFLRSLLGTPHPDGVELQHSGPKVFGQSHAVRQSSQRCLEEGKPNSSSASGVTASPQRSSRGQSHHVQRKPGALGKPPSGPRAFFSTTQGWSRARASGRSWAGEIEQGRS